MAQHYTESLILAWNLAATEALRSDALEIEPIHLMMSLSKLCDLELNEVFEHFNMTDETQRATYEADVQTLKELFEKAGVQPTPFRRYLRALASASHARDETPPQPAEGEVMLVHRSHDALRVFQRAEEIGAAANDAQCRPVHLLQALTELPNPLWAKLYEAMGITDPIAPLFGAEAQSEGKVPTVVRGGGPAAQSTQFLRQIGRDLTQQARDGKLSPVIGRRNEIRDITRALVQQRKNNVILVGEAGVGKTCIVEGLAQWLVQPDVPEAFRNKRIIEISMSRLMAGASHQGQLEERMEMFLTQTTGDPDIIVFIDEIHTMMGLGGGGSVSVANALKPALARGDLKCIGATTVDEYRNYIEKDPALERRFQVVWVDEPTREEAIEIIRGLRPRFEEHHGLEITDGAIEAAVSLSMRYLRDFRLPDKAIDLIDQACARARMTTLSMGKTQSLKPVSREQIAMVVAQRCRVPLQRLTENEAQRLLRMEEVLGRRVKGQDEAVKTVSEVIRTARAGLGDPRRPNGVFLFVGASGTGKTELAKTLASFLFDDEKRLIRIDMSEYKERYSISRLIGAPPGYVGYDEEGQLTGPVRTHPYSVVLFDEVEKAHPEVLDLLLQVFDDGHLTDAHGRRVSFSETTIILTSNLGSAAREEAPKARPLGFGLGAEKTAAPTPDEQETYRRGIMQAVERALRPELLNRIRNVVFFYPLSEEAIRQIIDKILWGLRQRLSHRLISLEMHPEAYDLLMEEGFDPRYGAREMERAIERLIVQPLSKDLLSGRFEDRFSIMVRVKNGQIELDDLQKVRYLVDELVDEIVEHLPQQIRDYNFSFDMSFMAYLVLADKMHTLAPGSKTKLIRHDTKGVFDQYIFQPLLEALSRGTFGKKTWGIMINSDGEEIRLEEHHMHAKPLPPS